MKLVRRCHLLLRGCLVITAISALLIQLGVNQANAGWSTAEPPVEETGGSVVEDFSYPGAAAILSDFNVKLISGDGHILFADCATTPVDNIGVIKVWTTEQVGADGAGLVCFKVTAPSGRLDLEVPGVFEIRGDGQTAGMGHRLTAVVTTDTGPPVSVVVNPSGSTRWGSGPIRTTHRQPSYSCGFPPDEVPARD